eukprot:905649-Rhodomonas_salina.1
MKGVIQAKQAFDVVEAGAALTESARAAGYGFTEKMASGVTSGSLRQGLDSMRGAVGSMSMSSTVGMMSSTVKNLSDTGVKTFSNKD